MDLCPFGEASIVPYGVSLALLIRSFMLFYHVLNTPTHVCNRRTLKIGAYARTNMLKAFFPSTSTSQALWIFIPICFSQLSYTLSAKNKRKRELNFQNPFLHYYGVPHPP